ncbi:WG repeat-containing protein [Albibacterium profundi]|uniref:WG repeat-containing protein n=1 Tax=Albibacterium profundi TaxID=3134906 RepID=A0ABV5CFJ0_9SPHI
MEMNFVWRTLTSISLFVLIALELFGQNTDIWVSYYNSDHLYGYKNAKGEVMISPRFKGRSRKFDKVVAVLEETNSGYESYYMLKNGNKFGRDSVYVFGTELDCESEGYIRFEDRQTEQVGMFNEFGEVAIPAEYNAITRFRNGLAFALMNAKKEYWDKNDNHEGCNHWSWTGGEQVLINQNNEVLVRITSFDRHIDLYSLTIQDAASTDPIRVSYLGTNGKYYSFIDKQKLFKAFLETAILSDLSFENLSKHSYTSLVFWTEDDGWTSSSKEDFLKQNAQLLRERLSILKTNKAEYFIGLVDSTPMPQAVREQLSEYYDNCGAWDVAKYPIYEIILTHRDEQNKRAFQDHFTFIQTKDEIKFISSTIREAK